jgi:hypothetical protein
LEAVIFVEVALDDKLRACHIPGFASETALTANVVYRFSQGVLVMLLQLGTGRSAERFLGILATGHRTEGLLDDLGRRVTFTGNSAPQVVWN